jgi:hypothetical protein
MPEKKPKVPELEEAKSGEAASPTSADDERARVRAAEYSPLIASILDAEETE